MIDFGKEKGKKVAKRVERYEENSAWLSIIPSTLDGTEVTRDEWLDNIKIRYGHRPKGLPDRCDGCGKGFTVEHALSCKVGGLVGQRHDDVRDEWADLCTKATTFNRVSTEPPIKYGNGVSATCCDGAEEEGADLGDESRGDVGCFGFWKKRRFAIFDIRITDTDAKSYGTTKSAKLLERMEKEKKDKYSEACLERRRDFTPMVYSVDGMAGKEARAAERRLAAKLAGKWGRQYSKMVAFVKTRMALAVVRSNTLLLRGDRATSWRRRAPGGGEAAANVGITALHW